MLKNSLCAVLVPALRHIEPECEDGLRELERRGYSVIRQFGFAAIDQSRNWLIAQALAKEYQEIVWLDSDMGFNPADVDRLRNHNKPIVVGLYSMKGKGGVAAEYLPGEPEFGPKAGLHEIRYSGLGFCYTKRQVYDKINLPFCDDQGRKVQPFFIPMIVNDEGVMRYLPEDFAFFHRARGNGFKVLADTSIALRHYGRFAYSVESFRPAHNFKVQSHWGDRQSLPGIHVIMQTFNSQDVIMRCLQSLEASMAGRKWALSVVDSGTDGTLAFLNEFAQKTKAQGCLVNIMPNASYARAMNSVLDSVDAFVDLPALMFIDPSSQFMPARLEMLKWMLDSDVLVAWGNYLLLGNPSRTIQSDDAFRTPVKSSTILHRSTLKEIRFDETIAGDAWLDLLDRVRVKSPMKTFIGGLTSMEYPQKPRVLRTDSDPDANAILGFYSQANPHPKIPVGSRFFDSDIINTPKGLGDALILSPLPSAIKAAGKSNRIWAPFPEFEQLAKFIPDYEVADPKSTSRVAADLLQAHYDMGNGHFTQRLHRALGLPVPIRPGTSIKSSGKKVKGRVGLHFSPGRHSIWQKKNIHPRAREIYKATAVALQGFIDQHPLLEFVEIGSVATDIVFGVEDKTGLPIGETIELLDSCEWFIGIVSGPMHLATGLGCKCVVIINFPDPTQIFLPTLLDIPQVESEWLYPQNVHLHQEGEGVQVKQFSLRNLELAFDGGLYPFWSDKYLNLINE